MKMSMKSQIKTFDKYLFYNLLIAATFVSIILATVIFLTQSLRFLELVIESGAAASTFWTLTILALPRFFEIIMPLALMIAVIFTYNRMTTDSELIVMRAIGTSPLSIATPALSLALLTTLLLWAITMWVAPQALSAMQHKRQEVKAQLSNVIFKENIFNQAGKGLTVYARTKAEDGTLKGLMIHDEREGQAPSTILAKSGIISSTEEGFRVTVFNGQRQEYDIKKKILSRLNFERYIIDIPDNEQMATRWKQPDERTIYELLNPDLTNKRDAENKRDFIIEIHRRIISPLLAVALTIISCAALLIGPVDRRGQAKRILIAIAGAIIIQSSYIISYNLAKNSNSGLVMMYALTMLPTVLGLYILSSHGEKLRRFYLYNTLRKRKALT